jgi:hypothetical protein
VTWLTRGTLPLSYYGVNTSTERIAVRGSKEIAMFEFRCAPDDDAAPKDTSFADTRSRDAAKRPTSSPVPRVDPVQIPLSGSYSMDGMTAILPELFPAPESSPRAAGSRSTAIQQQASKTDKPRRKKS